MANSYGFAQQIKKGRVPDGYMTTEAGVLPVEWHAEKMSSLIRELTQAAGEDTYETVSISAGKGFVNQAQKFGKELSGKQYEKYIVLHRGDFSYNKGNLTVYPQGCIYRLRDRESVAVPNVFESFSIERGDSDYYEQLFISGFLNKQLYSKINRGVRDNGLLNLTGGDFYSCSVPVPPIPEQKRIAEILFQCDRVIELYQCEIEEIKKMKRAYFEKMFPKQGSRSPEIRFHGYNTLWKQCRLKDVTRKIGSGKTPLGGKKVYQVSGIPLIRSQNVINDRVDLTDVVYIDAATNEEMENSSVRYGDVLLNITGASIGRSAVYKEKTGANVNQHVCIIRPNNVVSSEFIQLQLSSHNGQKQINLNQTGGGRQGLNFEQIGKMKFLFPSEDEQKCIGEFFEYFNHLITLHLNKLEEMQKAKKALMQLLLTGIVRVNL